MFSSVHPNSDLIKELSKPLSGKERKHNSLINMLKVTPGKKILENLKKILNAYYTWCPKIKALIKNLLF